MHSKTSFLGLVDVIKIRPKPQEFLSGLHDPQGIDCLPSLWTAGDLERYSDVRVRKGKIQHQLDAFFDQRKSVGAV